MTKNMIQNILAVMFVGTLATFFVIAFNDTRNPAYKPENRTQALVDNFRYVKNKKGLCFGVSNVESLGVVVVNVPCEKVGL